MCCLAYQVLLVACLMTSVAPAPRACPAPCAGQTELQDFMCGCQPSGFTGEKISRDAPAKTETPLIGEVPEVELCTILCSIQMGGEACQCGIGSVPG
ncbi:hypothetical protein BsWGS_25712 [Bradybaena similaris]